MTGEPFSAELVPFPVDGHLPGVPAPTHVRLMLTEQFNLAVQRERDARAARGATGEQAVWPLVRSVEGFRDLIGEYARAFLTVAATAKQVHEEELFEAVPEQDGIPLSALNVPDLDGSTIRVKAKTKNEHQIDRDQVLGALAALIAEQWAADPDLPAPAEQPEQFAMAVAARALDMMGAAALKVTHVRSLAAELGHQGADSLAGVVSDAITTRRLYDGVDVARIAKKAS